MHHTADSDQIMSTFMDPIGGQVWAGGVHLYDNQTGQRVNGDIGYEIFYSAAATNPGPATFGKAAGLGDLETMEIVPSIEIGNRVWFDQNKNGIQDGGEAGIDGVDVTLKCGADTKTIQTANGGQYYFSNVAGGNATFMDSGESCTLSVDGQQVALTSRALTTANADGQTDNALQTDIRDSDATPNATNSNLAEITFTVGKAGENNHSLDFGYSESPIDLSLTKTVDKTNVKHGETVKYTLTVTNSGPGTANNAEVKDQLPAGVTYQTHNTAKGTYTSTTGIWAIGSLTNGESATLTIDVTVN